MWDVQKDVFLLSAVSVETRLPKRRQSWWIESMANVAAGLQALHKAISAKVCHSILGLCAITYDDMQSVSQWLECHFVLFQRHADTRSSRQRYTSGRCY